MLAGLRAAAPGLPGLAAALGVAGLGDVAAVVLAGGGGAAPGVAAAAPLGVYPIGTAEHSSTTLYQVPYHTYIQ